MTIFRLGYVAMSVHVENSSPSKTMTYKNFSNLRNREAAIKKLENIAINNIDNCLRLLKHNKAYDITFFRLSSRIVPLATHEELHDWDYISAISEALQNLGDYARKNKMRIDFHPDHFVVLNSPKKEIVRTSVENLRYHYLLLKAMGITAKHRSVLHVGGSYADKDLALERFIDNWGRISPRIQEMIMLENDDKTFNVEDVLYLCEKLNIPHVFDLHHHLANHNQEKWINYWGRTVETWSKSHLPVKMHISSPKDEKQFRNHADFIDPNMFLSFCKETNGSTEQIDCMIEAKQKDEALFQLVENLKKESTIKWLNNSTFMIE